MTEKRNFGAEMRRIVKTTFDQSSPVISDAGGYVSYPEENLVAGVYLAQFKSDLEKGAGHELSRKFCAVHSSCALAVNTFAPFKDRAGDLVLLGRTGYDQPMFEMRLPTGLNGTPPTLDVYLKNGSDVVAIESKFLEYVTPKSAEFSTNYTHKALSWAEDCWWQVMEHAKRAGKRHLDVAQLVKHYFGLSRLLHKGRTLAATLLYLFWEPENAPDIALCRRHRTELEELAAQVAYSKVVFQWMTYPDLWQAWSKVPALAAHAGALVNRYRVCV